MAGLKLEIVGAPRTRFTVVVLPAVTRFEDCVVDKKPLADALTSNTPGLSPEMEYDPVLPVVAVPFTTPD